VDAENVSATERDPPTTFQRQLVESQLARMEVGLTNQRVVAARQRTNDVTVMTSP